MVKEQDVIGVRVLKNGMRAGYVLQKDGTRKFRFLGMTQKKSNQDGGKKKTTKKKTTKKKPVKKKTSKGKSKKKQKGGQ